MYGKMQTRLNSETVLEFVCKSGRKPSKFLVRIVCLPTRIVTGYLVAHVRNITSCSNLFRCS